MTATADALHALGRTSQASLTQRAADTVTSWLSRRTSRRGFLVRAGVIGSAFAVDTIGFALKPQSAYAAVCGPGSTCGSGWTVFCATINNGVNACPPGSIAAGWWKADGASLCGGKARYIVDCNATCSNCGGGGSGICARSCWSCRCTCGPSSTCDQRKTCCNAFRYGQCHQEVAQVGGVTCRVVSCTPPWKWEKCSTAPATDNNTRNHSSAQLPASYTSITAHYIRLGENGSRLGATVYGELAVAGGRAQRYQSGRISASTATGAHETLAPIAARYVATGGEGGPLGFPVTGTVISSDGSGMANRFQRGRISSHPQLGTFVLLGAIAARYASASAENGTLGFPLSDSAATADGAGSFARFQHGRASQKAAGEVLLTHDVIADAYDRAQGEVGPMSFPIASEEALSGGRVQRFEQGRISFSTATGAHWMSRLVAAKYVELGAEGSPLGFPTTDETDARAWPWKSPGNPEVRSVTFEHGTISHEVFTGRVIVQQTP
ncbi:MAG: hypothetical protein QOE99_1928 [Actinomycetota bacterium]|nr:hypothetical protein [Actinomycetota bacterium]